ncbi:MAG: tRNA (cytidine(56)-2'-O)-methyltransferase [Candidatus Micrarchaeota archaeon]
MIVVLRLGHRLPRDERITTHVALVARAFGADGIFYTGQKDSGFEESVKRICENWGGDFSVRYANSATAVIKEHKKKGFAVAHATMYGIPLPEVVDKLKANNDLLVIVGGEQVPAEIYQLADFNVAVTSQPHSEVAALALLLDRVQRGTELERGFDSRFKGKIKIEPSERSKRIRK